MGILGKSMAQHLDVQRLFQNLICQCVKTLLMLKQSWPNGDPSRVLALDHLLSTTILVLQGAQLTMLQPSLFHRMSLRWGTNTVQTTEDWWPMNVGKYSSSITQAFQRCMHVHDHEITQPGDVIWCTMMHYVYNVSSILRESKFRGDEDLRHELTDTCSQGRPIFMTRNSLWAYRAAMIHTRLSVCQSS
jgi:hypothetical protein